MGESNNPEREVLAVLRRIARAIDLHSRHLIRHNGVTVPQLIIMQLLRDNDSFSTVEIARLAALSQATVTDIITRLESRALITRQTSSGDRRKRDVRLTDAGRELVNRAPDLLHTRFVGRFSDLSRWEQYTILASIHRLAQLMEADRMEGPPIPSSGQAGDFVPATQERIGILPPAVSGLEQGREMRVDIKLSRIDDLDNLPSWISEDEVVDFFNTTMQPYQDKREDIRRAMDYAFGGGPGGFLMLACEGNRLVGELLMLKTGMRGYVPPYILLFVAVHPDMRGRGLGRRIIEESIAHCDGDVKLHVEYDNPARRLYERIGFATKYAEMRYKK